MQNSEQQLRQIIDLLEEIHNDAGKVREWMGLICGKIAEIENRYRRITIEIMKMKNE